MNRSHALLWHACQALEKTGKFISGRTIEDYESDDMLRSAVERQLEIVGEALSVLRRDDPIMADRIPNLAKAVGLRNILIHGYMEINHSLVWGVAETFAPALHERLNVLLNESVKPPDHP